MRENVVISYRGASYEIGRAQGIYGIWAIADPASEPLEWWPETADGWYSAWSRFSFLEVPGSIGAVAESRADASGVPPQAVAGVALLVIGVVGGVVGLFPGYLNGASLASQPAELVPHAIYLAAWAASAVLISLGGARLRIGAMLGVGTSLVTFGFFLSDAGTPIAGGAHLMGAGLVLGLFGWLTCAVGSVAALATARPARAQEGRRRSEIIRLLPLSLCALGVAAAFAPAWDSYVLTTSGGTTQSFTAGNVFSNPAPVIAGNMAVMVAFVAVVVAAGLWRGSRRPPLWSPAPSSRWRHRRSRRWSSSEKLPHRRCSAYRQPPPHRPASGSPPVSPGPSGSTARAQSPWSSSPPRCSARPAASPSPRTQQASR